MVMLLMMPMTLVNQAVSILGLNITRTSILTGGKGAPSLRDRKSRISVVMICCA